MNTIESLEALVAMIPILKAAVPAELSIAICDTEKFIAYWPGEDINLEIRVGQSLHHEEPLTQAIRNNVALKAEVPASFYGFEFIGTATPLHDSNGNVIGGIAIQLRKQSELISIADQISGSLSEANERLSQVAEDSSILAESAQHLLTLAHQTVEQVKETVASTNVIQNTLKTFEEAISGMRVSIEQMTATVERQATKSREVSDFIEEVNRMSDQLNEFAKKL